MTATASEPVHEASHLERWQSIAGAAVPEHTSYCRPQMADGAECVCAYHVSAALHSVLLAHKPTVRPRIRTCPEHSRERIWSTLSYAADTCMDCTLDLEHRCESCPATSWPCETVTIIADRLGAPLG